MKLPLSTRTWVPGAAGGLTGGPARLSPEEESRMRVVQQQFREMVSDEVDGLVFKVLTGSKVSSSSEVS
jgi:hypothetical protein